MQVLLQVFPQAGKFDGVAQCHHLLDRGRLLDAGKIADRTLHFLQQIVEHRPHGLEYGLGVLGGGGVALEVLGLGEGELEFLG